MPTLNFDNPTDRKPLRFGKNPKAIFGIGALATVVALGSTLAANISLNGNAPVEFGQGQTATTACDSSISFTPRASFVNSSQSGAFTRYVGSMSPTSFEIADISGLYVGQAISSNSLGNSDVITSISQTSSQDTGSGYQHFPNGTYAYTVNFSGPGNYGGPTDEPMSFMGGGFYFSSLSLSHVDSTACSGKNFTISLYGTGAEPLATYYVGDSGTDFTSGDGGFTGKDFTDPTDSSGTLVLTHPSILSTDVKRITIESGVTSGILLASFDAASSNPSLLSTTVHQTGGHPSEWVDSIAGLPNITDLMVTGTTPGLNGSLDLVPGSGDYLKGNLGSGLNGLTRASVELWVNIDPTGNPNQSLFSFDTEDILRGHYDGCGYSIRLSLGFIGSNTCNGETFGASTSGLTAGWHHIVWIASTGARATQKIYVDGTAQSLSANTSPDEFGDVNVDEHPRPNIGNGKFRVPGWGDVNFSLGALRIYSGEISASKVLQDYNEFSSRL